MILAIDPGTTDSGWCVCEPLNEIRPIYMHGKHANEEVVEFIKTGQGFECVVIEMFECRGKSWVGKDCIETIVWTGRFTQRARDRGMEVHYVTRSKVKTIVTGVATSNDAIVRGSLIDIYGGAAHAIGRKSTPGPLYGIHGDEWAALAVGYAWEAICAQARAAKMGGLQWSQG